MTLQDGSHNMREYHGSSDRTSSIEGTTTLTVVSHRPPMIAAGDGWQRAPGGLVSALRPALSDRRAHWYGHVEHPVATHIDGQLAVSGLLLRGAERRDAIDGYCNRTLWPALHGAIGDIEQLPDWSRSYRRRSVKTAKHLADAAEEGSTVWLHDYHMFGVAGPLATLRPDLRIGLFCHTPIDHAALSMIADIDELAQSLGTCHFIGTQTGHDADQLCSLLEASGVDAPAIGAVPVAIDHQRWVEYRRDPVVRALATRHSRPRGLLAVGVDRVDYTKGLTHKLLAIELLLDSGIIESDDFRLIQVAVPSRTDVPAYAFLLEQLREIAERINLQFPRSDAIPVVDIHWNQLAPRELAGIMRAADVALITPVRDGMNLVALEFSVLNGDRPCDIILGQSAGAAELIGPWCSTVDGSDVLAVAAALRELVGESLRDERSREDRLRRSGRRSAAAARRSSADWARSFLSRLEPDRFDADSFDSDSFDPDRFDSDSSSDDLDSHTEPALPKCSNYQHFGHQHSDVSVADILDRLHQ